MTDLSRYAGRAGGRQRRRQQTTIHWEIVGFFGNSRLFQDGGVSRRRKQRPNLAFFMAEITRITLLLGVALRANATQAVQMSEIFLSENNHVSVGDRGMTIRAVLKKVEMSGMREIEERGFSTLGNVAVALQAISIGDRGLWFRIIPGQMQVDLP